jgi:hypothetical protein
MVSTQAVLGDLRNMTLIAGDDAELGSARRVPVKDLTPESLGIPDHFDMIAAAFPEYFSRPEVKSNGRERDVRPGVSARLDRA